MTVLNFMVAREAVYVLTDTLVSYVDDLAPMTFATKVYAVPHLEGLICGTGNAPLIAEWFATANHSILAKHMEMMDSYAPAALRKLAKRHGTVKAGEREITTTIYHFGYSAKLDGFTGFAYRSTNDFVSERLPEGFGFKPPPDGAIDGSGITELPRDFISLAQKQKVHDQGKDPGERVCVGGQLVFYTMQREPDQQGHLVVQTSIRLCHDFDDFPAMWQRAAARIA